ncbi:SurA N-terminal domain-containing protein [Halobacillus halophilus]|uniref:SurA N-terminal domain-containing protein n=1 Tax=Halobacillus halophilus TaxID=1570 RepID=UPI00059F8AF9|nr:SurA N-terminal domain-containing protein [Halobacillus halophilus]
MTLNKKWLLSLSLALFIALLTACGNDEGSGGDSNNEEAQQEESSENSESSQEGEGSSQEGENSEQPQMPEPDLEGVPEVVATVNGEEIPKEEFTRTYESQFQQAAMQSQMSGQEVNQEQLKKQTAEGLVGQELLVQEANDRGLEATEEEVNERITEVVESNQGVESKEQFFSTIEEQQGMSEEEVRSQLQTQVKVDKLLAEENGDLEPTEEEIKQAYDDAKAQQEESGSEQQLPSYEEAKPTLKQQLTQQKESQAYQALVEKLREDADVKVNL